jgi:predicted ATPase
VESHIAALLRKLGVADRAALAAAGMDLRRMVLAEAALPAPLTSLVGRDGETRELAALLDAHRLVTLIGPAGVGKTRLALRVAGVLADGFAAGVRPADLAPVQPELVGDALARALGVVPEPGWALSDILREVAAEMDCLLLVENREHVVSEAAEIVADLLGAGSQVRVLATSREPLGVPGEVSYQVRPLPVPAPEASTGADTIGSYDAVRLFVERAATASPGFTLTDAIAPAVAALCERLDGLPLAIELAASRMRTFGPAELVEHLDQRFELLSAGARTAQPRHRTLRSAIDWSYALLDDDERTLFDRLGVFPADFDCTAVESVCQAGGLGGEAVIGLLPRLVDKSLVSTVARDTAATGCSRRSGRMPPTGWPAQAPSQRYDTITPPTTSPWPSRRPSSCRPRTSAGGSTGWPPSSRTCVPRWPTASTSATSSPRGGWSPPCNGSGTSPGSAAKGPSGSTGRWR